MISSPPCAALRGSGAGKMLRALGLTDTDEAVAAALAGMRETFAAEAQQAWAAHVAQWPEHERRYGSRVAALLFRLPTHFEVENILCEGRKMLKVLIIAAGRAQRRHVVKRFDGASRFRQPVARVPIVRTELGSSALAVVELCLYAP